MIIENQNLAATTVLGVVGEPLDGVGYVRFAQPFEHLGRRGLELRTLGSRIDLVRERSTLRPAPSALDGVSAVVFPQLVATPVLADGTAVDVVGGLCDEATRRGIPVIYSVDDYLPAMDASNPNMERVAGSIDNLGIIRRHASAVIATTPPLAAGFEDWGLPVHVLPNTIDPRRWVARPHRGGRPRIGWAGSSTHLDDLLMIAPALLELQQRIPFDFVVFGLCDLPLADQMAQIRAHRAGFDTAQRERAATFRLVYDLLHRLGSRHVPFGAMPAFFDTLPELDLDIGLCPLQDTPFNRCKSALKFYEYAACETLCVASDVVPYRGEVSLLAENRPKAWYELLERLLRDPDLRRDEQRRQRAWVMRERTIDGWCDAWADSLHSVLDRTTSERQTYATIGA